MDYPIGQTSVKLAFLIFTVISSSCALLERALEHPPEHQDRPNSISKEDIKLYYCDFESLCHWTISNHCPGGDLYVTSPQQHRANRWGVQPIKDHSPGQSKGHFLLLKPSSTHVAARGCLFQITSPAVLTSGPLCRLRFACYQPEPHTGNVSAFIKHNYITPVALTLEEQVGGRAQWKVLEALIGQSDEPFQVILQYPPLRGHEDGYLAIDSLELIDCVADDEDFQLNPDCENHSFHCDTGTCVEQQSVCDFHTHCTHGDDEELICSTLPLGSYCSFESDMCGWMVSHTKPSWKLVSGQQLTKSTDLLGKTLKKTKGHFLFLKVEGQSDESDALVQSPAFLPTTSIQECQLRFSLYLYGDFNGSIVLSIVENGTLSPPVVWKKSGKWKDSWQDINLQITKILVGFFIKVQVLWASGSKADIALDDISLSPGCFETDLNEFLMEKIPSQDHELTKDRSMDPSTDLDDNSPLPEPFASDVSLLTWLFTSCGASGPLGPTQAQCDSAYRNSNISVLVGKEGPVKGVQMWRVPATQMYKISAYGAGGGKGAKNHNKRSNGVFISAIFKLEAGDILYILIGQQGEDACPGRNPLTRSICLGESSVIEDGLDSDGSALEWAGGGGGGGGATYIYRMENGEAVPLLIAAGGGGKAYLEDPESSLEQMFLEQYENEMTAAGVNGKTGSAGGGGGWNDSTSEDRAGRSMVEGGQGGTSCPQALEKLGWATSGGFGGGGGACTAGGGGGGYRGGDAPLFDGITADGQDGVSFVHPSGEIFLQPLAVMDSHGEAVIKVYLNCSHCQTQSCKRDEETKLIFCLCENDEVLGPDNITCSVVPLGSVADGPPSLIFILVVISSTVVTGVVLTCASLTLSKRLFQFCISSVPSTFHRL